MKRFVSPLHVIVVVFAAVCVLLAVPALSQENVPLRVSEGSICIDIVDLSCVGANDQFPPEAGRLYCLTRILGASEATHVTHVWYYEDTERARVKLDVRSSNWRTYSSKLILPREIGRWRIDVVDPEGNRLIEIPFEITPH